MVNQNVPLVLSGLYEYDFASCAYNILRNIGWDLNKVDPSDKEQRNIAIGYIQKANPDIGQYIQLTISNLVDFYIEQNALEPNEIILRQKDSITTTKSLKIVDRSMEFEFRGIISKLIISTDRKKWLIIYSDGRVVTKGMTKNLYDDSFYIMFRNIDFANRCELINNLEKMRRHILQSDKISWFVMIEDDAFVVPIIGEGFLRFRKSSLRALTSEDIDKTYLWEEYIWPFVQSIIVHCSIN